MRPYRLVDLLYLFLQRNAAREAGLSRGRSSSPRRVLFQDSSPIHVDGSTHLICCDLFFTLHLFEQERLHALVKLLRMPEAETQSASLYKTVTGDCCAHRDKASNESGITSHQHFNLLGV